MPPTNTTKDPFLKNRINSSLGFKKGPSSNLDLLPRTRTGSSDLPKMVPMFFWGRIFATWQEKKRGEVGKVQMVLIWKKWAQVHTL